nr:endonuclease/exonuclease/phosphatase family protein [Desulfosporosinus sp. Sb-LF]
MAFRKKYDSILAYKPDILVVPECENLDRYSNLSSLFESGHKQWIGENQSKGLGVFSSSQYKLSVHEMYNPEFKYILPMRVEGLTKFILFAIWAMNDRVNPFRRYIAQIWLALKYYDSLLDESTIICGDFNSNVIWDNESPKRAGTHTDVVNYLKEKGIKSTYHVFNGEEQGKETQPTLYMYRKKDKPYHIDYCFASENLLARINGVDIGSYEEWSGLSDHSPISVTFE